MLIFEFPHLHFYIIKLKKVNSLCNHKLWFRLYRLTLAYGIAKKGINYVVQFLKGKIHEGSCKVKSYKKRNLQYQWNTLFKEIEIPLTSVKKPSMRSTKLKYNQEQLNDNGAEDFLQINTICAIASAEMAREPNLYIL